MGSRVELFEQIRKDRDREGLSIRELARRHGVHRRAVRQALASPLPPERKRPQGRPAPKLGPYRELIDSWLEADRKAPRKQRHTARRIWQRLGEEHDAKVAESTVRNYVRRRRRELCPPGDAYVPQVHEPAAEAEVDWGEAQVVLHGQPTKVYLFHMRACHSGASFCMAFMRETQQAFLEAHVEAFGFFGGVFELVRYDNLRAAVKKVLRGRRREESDRFVALRSHYLYESQFTLAGIEGAHEKGGVEGEVGRMRRRHLVPVPEVDSLAELNERLEDACLSDLGRRIAGRTETVGEALSREARELRALPIEDFDAAEQARPRVDQKALATVRQNRYSVPVGLVGLRVLAKMGRARSCSGTMGARLPATSAFRVASESRRRSTTTSICLSASRARSRARWRLPSSASKDAGRAASTSCGARLPSAVEPARPPGRWSTWRCSPASWAPREWSLPCVVHSRPARSMVPPSRCSPAKRIAPRRQRLS